MVSCLLTAVANVNRGAVGSTVRMWTVSESRVCTRVVSYSAYLPVTF